MLVKAALILVSIALLLALGQSTFQAFYPFPGVKYGVSFSPRYATYLKLDWKQVYIRILDDLKARNLRLPTYWDTLEPKEGNYDFSQTDFILDEAQKRNARVILTIGVRQFRYPECYIPSWAKQLSVEARHQQLLDSIRKVVERYKTSQAISAWEIENEPLLSTFGQGCDTPDKPFLKKEVDLVKLLDQRPIIQTDSGELGFWVTAMQFSDVFGTTVYRSVYNPQLGFFTYPILPYMYNLKSFLVRSIFANSNQKTILVELQAEPWFTDQMTAREDVKKQASWFSVRNFKDNVEFGKKTGFDEDYLWGVEWWYFMAGKGDSSYLNYAKSLFNN